MGESIDHAVWRAFFVDGPDPAFVYAVGDAPRFVLTAVNQAWLDATGIPFIFCPISPNAVGGSTSKHASG